MTALLLCGFLNSAMAFKVAAPGKEEIMSPNGKYVLKVDPDTKVHQVCEGAKVLWTFKQEVWHNDFFLSDDGKHVLSLAWHFVKEEDTKKGEAVTAYSAEGKVLSKTYQQVSKPEDYQNVRPGPVGDFWRIWIDGTKRKGEVVTLLVKGKKPLSINLTNPAGGD